MTTQYYSNVNIIGTITNIIPNHPNSTIQGVRLSVDHFNPTCPAPILLVIWA